MCIIRIRQGENSNGALIIYSSIRMVALKGKAHLDGALKTQGYSNEIVGMHKGYSNHVRVIRIGPKL